MRLALVGTGQMGTAVGEVAGERGHEVLAHFNSSHPLPGDDRAALRGAEAIIDFSLPDLAAEHIERYCRWGIPAVIGTTGWYDRLDDVRNWVMESEACVLYAPNFSLGIALLVRSLRAVMPLLEQLPEYDAYVHEVHHVKKVDSPSGTALLIGNVLLEGLSRKNRLETETQHGRIDAGALHVSSSRGGQVIGQHTIALDSAFDEVELIHRAKSRKGFAFGAVKAAEWLPGRTGLFTLEDVVKEWMEGRK